MMTNVKVDETIEKHINRLKAKTNDNESRVTFVGGSLDGTTRVLPRRVYDFHVQIPATTAEIDARVADFESDTTPVERERYLRHSSNVFMISSLVEEYKRATKSRRPSSCW